MKQLLSSNIRVGSYDLDSEQVLKILLTVDRLMTVQQPFLRQGYTLKDLSRDTSLPLHHLSAFINQYHGIRFNEFINRYRISHIKQRIENEEWKMKKLEAIAEESGFNNRNTFSIAFKKVYGQSPSEYMKMVRKVDFANGFSN
ncbi:MAG: helix-turn-helix transcriptional regulator [Bacteroidetes bacterium]|nr:helix-turn-helix transcriptional regulator [Bacteroidota bacterium]